MKYIKSKIETYLSFLLYVCGQCKICYKLTLRENWLYFKMPVTPATFLSERALDTIFLTLDTPS